MEKDPALQNLIRARLRARMSNEKRQGQLLDNNDDFAETIRVKLSGLLESNQFWNFSRCGREEIYRTCKCCGKWDSFSYRCNLKWCPRCQQRLGQIRRNLISLWAKRISQPKHVVLTHKNIPTLTRKIYRNHTRLLAKLRRTKFTTKITFEWQRKKSGRRRTIRKWMPPRPTGKTITSHPWLGGCVSTETTNEGNGWHVHAHLLIDCRFVSAGRLAKEWAKLVGQKFALVKVMDVREKDYLQEICKYVVEGSELAKWAPDLINEFVQAQRGLRMFNSFGSLREMAPEIRREINAQKPPSPTCECGADDFLYQSEESALLDDVRKLERNKSRPRHSVRVCGVEAHATDREGVQNELQLPRSK